MCGHIKFVCLFTLLRVSLCFTHCPASWTSHNGSCYFFSNNQDTWDNAMVRCQDHAGTLAEVKSTDINNLLVSMARLHTADVFWIGGKHDIRGSGWWMWMRSHTSMHDGYTNWAPMYPRDMYTRMMLGTRCALVKNSKWEDSKCDAIMHYACQK